MQPSPRGVVRLPFGADHQQRREKEHGRGQGNRASGPDEDSEQGAEQIHDRSFLLHISNIRAKGPNKTNCLSWKYLLR